MQPDNDEIRYTINNLKNNKSAGENKIMSEILKERVESFQLYICNLIKEVWQNKIIPRLIISEKGNRTQCDNYSGIAIQDFVCVRYLQLLLRTE